MSTPQSSMWLLFSFAVLALLLSAVDRAGISIVEITMTVPGAIEVMSYLSKSLPALVFWYLDLAPGFARADVIVSL